MASRFTARALQQVARQTAPRALRQQATVLPRTFRPTSCRTFVTSSPRFGEGQTDSALADKLTEELEWEKQNTSSALEPDWLAEFKNEGVWSIDDKPGFDEVKLTRTFGSEK